MKITVQRSWSLYLRQALNICNHKELYISRIHILDDILLHFPNIFEVRNTSDSQVLFFLQRCSKAVSISPIFLICFTEVLLDTSI